MLRDTNQNQTLTIDQVSQTLNLDRIKRAKPAFKVPKNITQDLRTALTAFFKGETLKAGNYVATDNALVYRSVSVLDGFTQDVICLRLIQNGQPYYLGNSSRLSVVGTNVAFGRRSRNWGETEPQRVLNQIGVAMLPFSAFIQAGLKVTDTRILDQGGAETVKRQTGQNRDKSPKFQDVHFTGASLFQNGKSQFLFDIDRLEIKHGVFNPFIVELPRHVSSIAEAYDSLIPLEVRTAQTNGIEVKRQGEHFFIKVSDASQYKADKSPRGSDWNDGYIEGRMSAQGNRDHVATRFNAKSGLVSGFVKHQGREHLDTDLTSGWWRPVPNTAVKAFTISGDID